MKLSIITINYNNAIGLKRTMDSVYLQSFRDFEYIIVDGKSTDNSVAIIKSFQDNKSIPLTWISELDTGVYNAMNKGIKLAKGEYLLFLNSGDYLVNELVLSDVFSFDPQNDIICARCNISKNNKIIWTTQPPQYITFGTLYNVGLSHQSTFISKKTFNKLGLYNESFRYHGDIEFWYRSIILGGASTQTLPIITTDYNLDGISSCETSNPQFIKEHEIIQSNPIMQRIIPDYINARKYYLVYQKYQWIENTFLLKEILSLIFKVKRKLNK